MKRAILLTNRCNLLLRGARGCKFGNDCRFCHLHPVSKEELQGRPNKGFSKPQRQEKLLKVGPSEKASKARRLEATAAVNRDLSGIIHAGQLLVDGQVAVSVLTIGRNLTRGLETAKHVEEALGLPAQSVFVLAGLDFRNESHFAEFTVTGRQALYLGLRCKVLPAFVKDTRIFVIIGYYWVKYLIQIRNTNEIFKLRSACITGTW